MRVRRAADAAHVRYDLLVDEERLVHRLIGILEIAHHRSREWAELKWFDGGPSVGEAHFAFNGASNDLPAWQTKMLAFKGDAWILAPHGDLWLRHKLTDAEVGRFIGVTRLEFGSIHAPETVGYEDERGRPVQ